MADFKQFSNDLVVDIIRSAFYGEKILPIISMDFPNTSIADQVLQDSDTSEGSDTIDSTVPWEFGIEVMLVGEKYRRYVKDLELPSVTTVYFPVETDISVYYSYSSGSYNEPPEEEMDITAVENKFSIDEIWVEGESLEFTEETSSIFKKFADEHDGETDDDLADIVRKNQEQYPLISLITRTRRAY